MDGLRDGNGRFEIEYNKEPEDIDEAVYHAISFVQTRRRNSREHFADRQHKKYTRRMSDSDLPEDNEQLDHA